jgi:chemotaxis protein MotB
MSTLRNFGLGLLVAVAVAGCGHTDEEMAQKQREIDKLNADLKTAKAQITQDEAAAHDAQDEIAKLQDQLKTLGVSEAKSRETAEQLQQAVKEYQDRLNQLAAIEKRFTALRDKLQALNSTAFKVVVRNNLMVIQLPGDVLFDSGKAELRAGGKDALRQVADVVRSDKDLSARHFQVAGHTDNQGYPTGGPFQDNWGLSLMRARGVLLYMIAPQPKGGGLDPTHWSAAGFGSSDPIAGTADTQSNDERSRNRRVEIVIQPNVQEMLNLDQFNNAPAGGTPSTTTTGGTAASPSTPK